MRAHLYRPVQDNMGDVRTGATVRVLYPGTVTPITETIYAAGEGDQTVANPFLAANGVVDIYTAAPMRVRLGVKVGQEPEFFFNDVDILTPNSASTSKFILPSPVVLNTGRGEYAYKAIPAFRRGLVYRMSLTSNGTTNWALRVTSKPNGAGELMFEAVGIGVTTYQCSWPWLFENQQDEPTLYLGVDDINKGLGTVFTLTQLRGELFLP